MSKKKTPAKSTVKKTNKISFKSKLKQSFVWLAKTIAKLTLGLALGLVIYFIYLDNKVTQKFEGKKWQIPAQIYAKPLSLFLQKELSKQRFIDVLKQLKYRKVTGLNGAGEYKVSSHSVSLVRRAFDFPGKPMSERWLTVIFSGPRIARITEQPSNRVLDHVTLEPLLIERLQSPHHEDREFMPIDAFPEAFKDTLLLVEDREFYHHYGVSLTATLRALYQNIKAGRTVQGGSTLTQQLAKNFYLNHKRNLMRKVNEAFIALILDYRYSKDQVLEAYLNEVFLGQFHNRSIHGFGLASQYYFSKPINELAVNEFAVLMAIIKGPTYYNPHRQPKRALKRRDLVLRLMFEHHLLNQQEYKLAVAKPLGVSNKKQFLPVRYPAYISQVKRELKRTIKDSDIFSDGIKVYTNLDPMLQAATEDVVQRYLPVLEKRHHIEKVETASVSVDIKNAAIIAMVGGRNVNYAGFNRAIDLQRNIGSLVKPAVFLAALSKPEQYTLATQLRDQPITLLNQHGKKWSPENFSKTHEGQISLLHAFVRSKNVPTVNLGMMLGVDEVSDALKGLGVSSKIPRYPSLFLGALEQSPLQVSQMFSTLANKGRYVKLSTLRTVTSTNGDIIWQRNLVTKANFEPAAVYLANVGLKEVANSGTARYLKHTFPNAVFAGKTGTTDDLRDSWFTGFDGTKLTTFWVGKDDYSPVGLTGSEGALRMFVELNKIIPIDSLEDLPPIGITEQYFSPNSGLRYGEDCADAIGLPAIDIDDGATVMCGL